jgi:hypothetical protein
LGRRKAEVTDWRLGKWDSWNVGVEKDMAPKRGNKNLQKLYVRSLKITSYEGRVSELRAWLANRMALSQKGRHKERAEESPH